MFRTTDPGTGDAVRRLFMRLVRGWWPETRWKPGDPMPRGFDENDVRFVVAAMTKTRWSDIRRYGDGVGGQDRKATGAAKVSHRRPRKTDREDLRAKRDRLRAAIAKLKEGRR